MGHLKKLSSTERNSKIRSNLVRFSYANVFKPTAFAAGAEEKYSVAILIPKTDKEAIKLIQEEIDRLIKENRTGLLKGSGLSLPLHDGDDRDDAAYAGHYYLNAKSKSKPQVIDKDHTPLTSEEDFYSGCYGLATFNLYVIEQGVKGIAVGLGNIMKLKDGERLSGGASAAEEFDDLEFDDFDADDL